MENGLALRTLDDVERLAKIATSSGLCRVKRPEEAAVILLTGRELGLSPMQALRGIYVVNGAPVLSADLLVAVVRRSGLCASWRVAESTPERCTITTLRQGETEPAARTWTIADAKRAGITGKPIWAQYPAAMLRHRCAADLAREVYPDVVLGLYDPEELGGDPPRPPEPPAPTDEAPRSSPLTAFCDDLRDCQTLADVVACWHSHCQALHAADLTQEANGAVGDWMTEMNYAVTATEQQRILSRAWEEPALRLADDLARLGPRSVVEWYVRDARDAVERLRDPAEIKRLIARTWAVRSNQDARAPGKAFGAAVQAFEAANPARVPSLASLGIEQQKPRSELSAPTSASAPNDGPITSKGEVLDTPAAVAENIAAGAPGDWGYETPVGAALASLYRGESNGGG